MPISIDIDVEVSKDASGAIRKAQNRRIMDGMARGFAESQELVPEDRGTLRMSGFKPTKTRDGIKYGYRADHARPMEEGTQPFYPPIEPLLEWSRRVTGDPGLGYYLANVKIPEEGIDAQPYLEPSAEAVKNWLKNNTFSDYISREL